MAMSNASTPQAFTREEYGELLLTTTVGLSVALSCTNQVRTSRPQFRIPLINSEVPSGWYSENQEITLGDMGTDELVVIPKKTAGLAKISKELADDSTPEAASQVGGSIARSIARGVDSAFFGSNAGTGLIPKGLGAFADGSLSTSLYAAATAKLAAPVITLGSASAGGTFAAGTYYWKLTAFDGNGETVGSNELSATLTLNQRQVINWTAITGATGYKLYRGTAAGAEDVLAATIAGQSTATYTDTGTSEDAGTVPTVNTSGAATANFDPFTRAIFSVENIGANITHWLVNPADAEVLAKIKKETGSVEAVLQPDAHTPTIRTIQGRPMLTSSFIPPFTAYGIDGTRTYSVIRKDIEITRDDSVYFTSNSVAMLGVMRLDFGYAHPKSIARIKWS